MTKINKELLKGSSDIMILAVLADQPLYGYQIAKQIKALSADVLALGEGTLYPLLHRLEHHKLLESYWEEVSGRRRKYYSITTAGKKMLHAKTAEWNAFAHALNSVIKL